MICRVNTTLTYLVGGVNRDVALCTEIGSCCGDEREVSARVDGFTGKEKNNFPLCRIFFVFFFARVRSGRRFLPFFPPGPALTVGGAEPSRGCRVAVLAGGLGRHLTYTTLNV